ncbi:MAG TPA: hypothetical protein VFY65_11305, partial [Longimicrobium sp.]|nr:hypothetical protein [Longimicrobium sp.]
HPSSAIRAALALAVTLSAAACDGSPSAPSAVVEGEVAFTTGASLPAVPGFVAQANNQRFVQPAAVLSWQDVEGEDVYLIQWRVGDAGAWKTLVTTGRDRTTFGTDSVRAGVRNYYRIAAMTSAFQAGPFTTVMLKPGVRTVSAILWSDSTARATLDGRNYGTPVSYAIQYGQDPALADGQLTAAVLDSAVHSRHFFDFPVAVGNQYYYRAVATGEGGTTYGEILTITNGPPQPPAGVQTAFTEQPILTSSGVHTPGYRVQVSWTHPGAEVDRFRVQRRPVGGTAWTLVTVEYPHVRQTLDITVPVAPGAQYEHRVLACNTVGQCSASIPVQVTTTGMPAPANFTGMQRSSDGKVVLQWTDLASEEWYIIQWRADSTAGWTTILSSQPGFSFSQATTASVAAGSTNEYRIAGVAGGWRVGPWSYVSVVAAQGLHLAAQTGTGSMTSATSAKVNGTVTPNGRQVNAWFEWGTDPALAGASSTPPQTVTPSTGSVPVSATLGGLAPGTYYFRIVAANADTTVRGVINSVFVPGPPAVPVLTAAFSNNGFVVNLSWTHSGVGNPTRFRVYRRPDGGSTWTLLYDGQASARSHVDYQFPVTAPRSYDYYVAACNVANECASSSVQQVTTVPMDAPTGVTATRLVDGRVQVAWQDAAGTQTYLVQWRTESTGWQSLVSTGPNATSATVTQVTAGTTNYYRIAGLGTGNRPTAFVETSLVVP